MQDTQVVCVFLDLGCRSFWLYAMEKLLEEDVMDEEEQSGCCFIYTQSRRLERQHLVDWSLL